MDSSGVPPREWADASDLAALGKRPGPFLTVVLSMESESRHAARSNDVRWRALRDDLEHQGAPGPALAAVDAAVAEAHRRGRTLIVVADEGGAQHVGHWPDAPFREIARWEPLPSLAPLVERRQEAPPYVTVFAEADGAEVAVAGHLRPNADEDEGGPAERGERWHGADGADIAGRVTAMARWSEARMVLLTGDGRSVDAIRAELPGDVAALVAKFEGRPDPSDVERLVAEVAGSDTAALVRRLADDAGLRRTGVAPTVAALAAGQAEVLLVHDDPADERIAWFGDDPLVLGVRREDVAGQTTRPRTGRLVDALIRSALAGGAGVRVLPSPSLVDDGVAALLRWNP
ncbi:MAG TPA: hypothetical protein VFJ85_19070 [Acidimicrobiales bacterium]|nr:hypothetical protein [Acidimicrobiales bacterium]